MKQGQATRSGVGGQKREPISTAINHDYPGQIGIKLSEDSDKAAMHAGRGYSAPKAGSTVHHSGSQGKHK